MIARAHGPRRVVERSSRISANQFLLDTDRYARLAAGDLLSIIDGGARGELFEPFKSIDPHQLFVVALDPAPDAAPQSTPNGAVIHAALWNRPGTVELHVAAEPSTSSLFRPDEAILERFEDIYGYPPRRTVRTIEVPAVTIDGLLAEHPEYPAPDLIKLDIHGAEYQALEGAERALAGVKVVAVETWTLPIHRGQRTHAEVESLLNRHGFYLFHTERVYEMSRKGAEGILARRQIVGYDNVYCRDISDDARRSDVVKAIALADVYGHADYALELIRRFTGTSLDRDDAVALTAHIVRTHRPPSGWREAVRLLGQRMRRAIRRTP